MKKKVLALAAVIALTAPVQGAAYAHGNHDASNDSGISISPRWSAEEMHAEGKNSHLWIVNRAIDIMARDTTVVKENEVALLNEWRTDLEDGIYTADYENPYYDNSTFASHFYDPDTDDTYIPFAKNAKVTGAKYFKLAGEAYEQQDMQQAFFYLGLSLHYFGDINQPMHASNFTNISHPFGFHSKYENFVDTIKAPYAVTDSKGYWNFAGGTPEEWLHTAAVAAKKDAPGIVNETTKSWFLKASVSQEYANMWRAEVTPETGARLMEAQRAMAGYIHLWFDTYVNR
ncbi:phospholipase C [Bacillus manliponensis]|uniref:Phospholipase C n=1 Tax=Bacillus manliponensis TaxID=574376 RepID=A0A073JVA0_9BACI|nr:phospholipase C [Bacillus manliponensis]KEK18136.1 phospholipase C [Bacillus manliponensis]